MVQRLFAGARLDQIFSQLVENGFIGHQLARLIVHHQNVYFFLLAHFLPLDSGRLLQVIAARLSTIEFQPLETGNHATGGTTSVTPRAAARCSPVSPDIPKPPPPNIFRDPLSWLSLSKR